MKLPAFLHELLLRINFRAEARITFYQNISLLIDNDISMEGALEEIRAASTPGGNSASAAAGEKPHSNDGMTFLIDRLLLAIRSGQHFADALAPWVTPQEASIIAAGEEAGNLSEAFERVAYQLRKSDEVRMLLVKKVGPQVGILIAVIGVLAYLGGTITPLLTSILPTDRWHGSTHTLIVLTTFFHDNIVFIGIGLAAFFGSLVAMLPRLRGRVRDWLDNAPEELTYILPPLTIFAIYRMFAAFGFMMNVAAKHRQGFPLEAALLSELDHATPYLKERIEHTVRGIQSGATFGEALHNTEHNFPDPRTIGALRIISGKKGFDRALEQFTHQWFAHNVREIEKRANVLSMAIYALAGYAVYILSMGVMQIQSGATAAFGH